MYIANVYLYNLSIKKQSEEVLKVKKHESGVVKDPITIQADAKISELLKIKEKYNKQKALIDAFTSGMAVRHARYLEFEKQRRAANIETKDDEDYETVVTFNEVVLSREEIICE